MERLTRGNREDTLGPVGEAMLAARELLGLDIVCVSRLLRADERRRTPGEDPELTSLADDAVTVPLESADGRLFGSLVCSTNGSKRSLDERDLRFLRVLGRLIGGQIERDERSLSDRRPPAESAGMQALLAAVEARDRYTGEHSRSVVNLSVRVARELELPPREVARVEQVALLHDVGKVAIPDQILLKPGPLDETEMEVVRRHPAIGARIVGSVAGLAHLAPAIRSGHERWDGGGYPDGLTGTEIPLPSRITGVCDAYDAMVSRRPYRKPLTPDEAVKELRRHAGSQFCPSAATALIAALRRAPSVAAARRSAARRHGRRVTGRSI
jgi:HD-GYP domain-containing protein (c-di-GMP phosphodiesterase class II)